MLGVHKPENSCWLFSSLVARCCSDGSFRRTSRNSLNLVVGLATIWSSTADKSISVLTRSAMAGFWASVRMSGPISSLEYSWTARRPGSVIPSARTEKHLRKAQHSGGRPVLAGWCGGCGCGCSDVSILPEDTTIKRFTWHYEMKIWQLDNHHLPQPFIPMYCLGSAQCTPGSHSACALLGINWKILFVRRMHRVWG